MPAIHYKDFIIIPSPHQLQEDGKWTLNIYIRRNDRDSAHVREKNFYADNTLDSKIEAEQHCIKFGKRIIDGEAPGLTLEDI